MKRHHWARGERWLAAAAVCLTSATASAEDFSVTVTENALDTYAAGVGPIGGTSTYDLHFETFCVGCQAEYQGKCFQWKYEMCKSTVTKDWSWNLTNAYFDITPSGITFLATLAVTFDGQTTLTTIQRNGVAFYHATSDAILVLLDFLTHTQVPIYANYAGETHFLGNVSPYRYFNAIIPVGVANIAMNGKQISGDPANVQVILQNGQMRIESDVQFN